MRNRITIDRKSTNSSGPSTSSGWHAVFIKISLMFLLFSQIISCTPVIGLIYGVHQPRYVSDTNVAKYAEKINLKGDIYRLKEYSEENRGKYRYLGKRLPETLIFNSEGLITKFEIDCGSDLYSNAMLGIGAIDSLETGEQSFQDFIGNSYIVDKLIGEETIVFNRPVYVIKFAEFVGKLNKDHIPDQIRILKGRNDVTYILLNMDYTIPE